VEKGNSGENRNSGYDLEPGLGSCKGVVVSYGILRFKMNIGF
jgi:hypothetical protein